MVDAKQLIESIQSAGDVASKAKTAATFLNDNHEYATLLLGMNPKDLGIDAERFDNFLYDITEILLPGDGKVPPPTQLSSAIMLLERAENNGHAKSIIKLQNVQNKPRLKILISAFYYKEGRYKDASIVAEDMPSGYRDYMQALWCVVFCNTPEKATASFPILLHYYDLLIKTDAWKDDRYKSKKEQVQQQLASHPAAQSGLVLVKEFRMTRGAKNPAKICQIPDLDEHGTGLTLHQRQALAERVATSRTYSPNTHTLFWSAGKPYNHLVANIGFIMTNKKWEPKGDHRRVFYSIPIVYKQLMVHSGQTHTEPTLYGLLKDESYLRELVKRMKTEKGIVDNCKVYGVVLDCHSMFDMCEPCFGATKTFYHEWRPILRDILVSEKFTYPNDRKLEWHQLFHTKESLTEAPKPDEDTSRFSITIRFSSDCQYDTQKCRGIKAVQMVAGKTTYSASTLDLRQSDRNLLLHGNGDQDSTCPYSMWSGPGIFADDAHHPYPEPKEKNVTIEDWTIFTTSGSPLAQAIKKGEKPAPYHQQGKINLEEFSHWSTSDPEGADAAGGDAFQDQAKSASAPANDHSGSE